MASKFGSWLKCKIGNLVRQRPVWAEGPTICLFRRTGNADAADPRLAKTMAPVFRATGCIF
jgi:hypothetical protein